MKFQWHFQWNYHHEKISWKLCISSLVADAAAVFLSKFAEREISHEICIRIFFKNCSDLSGAKGLCPQNDHMTSFPQIFESLRYAIEGWDSTITNRILHATFHDITHAVGCIQRVARCGPGMRHRAFRGQAHGVELSEVIYCNSPDVASHV